MVFYKKVRKNKYGNRRVVINGIEYASVLEGKVAQRLELMKLAKEIIDYHPHYKVELIVNSKQVATHIVDFLVIYKEKKEFWEVKGKNATKTPVWALKKKITEVNYPNIKYRVITE